MSSSLIHQKIQEARVLLAQSHQEEVEGAVIAQKIAELRNESERLLRSAREKRVIGNSQLDASEALAKEYAAQEESTTAAAPAAPAKKRGGRPPKATTAAAATAPLPEAPVAAAAAKKGPKAKKAVKEAAAPVAKETKAKEAKTAKKDAKPKETAKAKAKEPKAPKAPREKRATGEKGPPLHEKIKIVMGSKEMTIDDVIEALKAHDASWVPKSRDLNAYISLVLSTHLEDYFDRVKRGIYKVKKNAPAAATAPSTAKEASAPAPTGPGLAKTNGKRGPSNGLEEFGTNVAESPFAGAEVAA